MLVTRHHLRNQFIKLAVRPMGKCKFSGVRENSRLSPGLLIGWCFFLTLAKLKTMEFASLCLTPQVLYGSVALKIREGAGMLFASLDA